MSSLFGEPDDKDRARWDIRRQIENLAVTLFGGRRIKRELRSRGVAPLSIDAVEPLPFIGAAAFYRDVADGQAREEAEKARGDGATWAEIADAAGIADDPEQDRSAAELAYEWVSPRPSMRLDEVNVYWTCGTCGERVKDHGPLGGSHPSDQESGHTEECTRHAADIAAWKTATGWE
jgi:hypothetical protein